MNAIYFRRDAALKWTVWTVCKSLRDDGIDTPIYATARDTKDWYFAGFAHLADDYLVKLLKFGNSEFALPRLGQARKGGV